MQEIPDKYTNNPDFQEFLNREFGHTAANATMEELAEFAFGNIEDAINSFKNNINYDS